MPKKDEILKDVKGVNNQYFQKKIYRNKIGVSITFVLFSLLYPIDIYLRTIFSYDGYLSGMVIIFFCLFVGMSIGQSKANLKFGDE